MIQLPQSQSPPLKVKPCEIHVMRQEPSSFFKLTANYRKWSHEPSSFSSWFIRGSWQLNSICKELIQTRWQWENDHILITSLQTQHMALCLLAVNSFSQLALHHIQLNTHLLIVHLNCKQREKIQVNLFEYIIIIWSHYWSHSPWKHMHVIDNPTSVAWYNMKGLNFNANKCLHVLRTICFIVIILPASSLTISKLLSYLSFHLYSNL